jgi:hypothetical protein
MNSNLGLGPARQQTLFWSALLGDLAARLSTAKTETPSHDAGSSRLAALLRHLRQRHRPRPEALHDASAAEFTAP